MLLMSQIEPVSASEISWAIKSIKANKDLAVGWISDSIIDISPDAVTDKLVCLINCIFTRGAIPTSFCLSRFHLSNKLKAGTPSLNGLRSIMISSPIVKLFKSVALRELKAKLERKISKAQAGSLPRLGTQIHLLRLLNQIKDIQDWPSFRPMVCNVVFIDFRSAFEKVSHGVLFSKL